MDLLTFWKAKIYPSYLVWIEFNTIQRNLLNEIFLLKEFALTYEKGFEVVHTKKKFKYIY
jgi:hypothetical protein